MRNDAESIHVPVPEYATGQTTIAANGSSQTVAWRTRGVARRKGTPLEDDTNTGCFFRQVLLCHIPSSAQTGQTLHPI